MCVKVGQSGLFYNFTISKYWGSFLIDIMQFLGNVEAKLDAKMRIFVPMVFRKVLSANDETALILRKDLFQNCLILYPISVWTDEVKMLRSRLSYWDKNQQQLFRQFVVDVEKLELDGSGRILMPKRFLKMINIESEIQLLGVDNKIEVWNKELLDETLFDSSDFGSKIQEIMNDYIQE